MMVSVIRSGVVALLLVVANGLAPAYATMIGKGDLSISVNGAPVVDLTSTPNTYATSMVATLEFSGTGSFLAVNNHNGKMNGTLTFSSVRGTALSQTLANFLVFDDGQGGTYNFSVQSVLTRNYANDPGVTSSVGLYILGSTLDATLGFDEPTPTSLTLTFNNTGNSAYSASATLAIPPAPLDVSEPISLALLGFGVTGIIAARRRQRA